MNCRKDVTYRETHRMKWISEETLRDCQIFRYSKMENGNEGVIPVKVEDLPGIEMGVDFGSSDGGGTKHPCEGCPTPVIGCAKCSFF